MLMFIRNHLSEIEDAILMAIISSIAAEFATITKGLLWFAGMTIFVSFIGVYGFRMHEKPLDAKLLRSYIPFVIGFTSRLVHVDRYFFIAPICLIIMAIPCFIILEFYHPQEEDTTINLTEIVEYVLLSMLPGFCVVCDILIDVMSDLINGCIEKEIVSYFELKRFAFMKYYNVQPEHPKRKMERTIILQNRSFYYNTSFKTMRRRL